MTDSKSPLLVTLDDALGLRAKAQEVVSALESMIQKSVGKLPEELGILLLCSLAPIENSIENLDRVLGGKDHKGFSVNLANEARVAGCMEEVHTNIALLHRRFHNPSIQLLEECIPRAQLESFIARLDQALSICSDDAIDLKCAAASELRNSKIQLKTRADNAAGKVALVGRAVTIGGALGGEPITTALGATTLLACAAMRHSGITKAIIGREMRDRRDLSHRALHAEISKRDSARRGG